MACSKKAPRVVRKRLADGTVRTYTYAREKVKTPRTSPDSLGGLLIDYRVSPEYRALKPRSRESYNRPIKYLEMVGDTLLIDFRRGDIMTMRNSIAFANGNQAANLFVRVTRTILNWAVENGKMEASPAHKIKSIPGGHLMAWTPTQAAQAIAGLSESLRRAVVLALYTGQRRSDLVRMTWADYDGGAIRVCQEKTGARLLVPCHAALRAELDTWKASKDSPFMLVTDRGRPWIPSYLSMALPSELKELGLPAGLNMHGLRKLAAANLAQAGCSAHEIAAITGHKTLAMVQLYAASANQEGLAEAAILKLERKAKTTAP